MSRVPTNAPLLRFADGIVLLFFVYPWPEGQAVLPAVGELASESGSIVSGLTRNQISQQFFDAA